MATVLAFDLGASSGRAILVKSDNDGIRMTEVHRFQNSPVFLRDTLYWDFPHLMQEIQKGMQKAYREAGYESLAVDTWGVDFGLLDERGYLLENPVHYRDRRTAETMPKVFSYIPEETLYQITGIQRMPINTIFQLASLRMQRPELLFRADTLLLMPNLIMYFLTGEKQAEFTMASTTAMLDIKTGSWSEFILKELNLRTNLFPPIVQPGASAGTLDASLCARLSIPQVPVINAACHDTASAVASVPCAEGNFLFLSCGTWSLMGIESPKPIISQDSLRLNFTNEGGISGTTRFLKNIMGLWIVQECLRHWNKEGEVTFDQLMLEADEAQSFLCAIDPDDARFLVPGNMPQRIKAYLAETGQRIPQTRGGIIRCVLESLALKYRDTLREIQHVTGQKYDTLYVVGGGSQNSLFMQMTADAIDIPIVAGPAEASALGNAMIQLIALGELSDIADARKRLRSSITLNYYKPTNAG